MGQPAIRPPPPLLFPRDCPLAWPTSAQRRDLGKANTQLGTREPSTSPCVEPGICALRRPPRSPPSPHFLGTPRPRRSRCQIRPPKEAEVGLGAWLSRGLQTGFPSPLILPTRSYRRVHHLRGEGAGGNPGVPRPQPKAFHWGTWGLRVREPWERRRGGSLARQPHVLPEQQRGSSGQSGELTVMELL